MLIFIFYIVIKIRQSMGLIFRKISFMYLFLVFSFFAFNFIPFAYGQDFQFTPCASAPSEMSDCFAASTSDNSCCYYSYAGITGCVSLNQPYRGQRVYGGLTFVCTQTWIKYRYFIILLILLFII
jgi:hypothetical protein